MKEFIDPIARLINQFNKLPAVGGKTAQRYALKILDMSEGEVEEFARVLLDTKKNVKYCSVCGNFTERAPTRAIYAERGTAPLSAW